MRRALLLLTVLALVALPMSGDDGWGDYYKRGLNAVKSQDWATVKASMESAITLKPAAQKPARWKNETLTYVPHFYLGVALFQLGDVDAALEAFRVSESQGVIQKSELWRDQRRWEAEAQKAKGRSAIEAVSDDRKAAENAISSAMIAQAGAVGAGADRSEDFQKATRLMSDATAALDKAGTDPAAYAQAERKANEAKALFESAQRNVRTRPVARPPAKPAVDPEKAAEAARLAQELEDQRAQIRTKLADLNGRLNEAEEKYPDDAEFQTFVLNTRSQSEQWTAMLPATGDKAELQRISQSVTSSIEELAQQTAALRAAAAAKAEPPPVVKDEPRTAEAVSRANAELKRAWSAYVKGDIDGCAKIANEVVESRSGSSDAYMLRGIASYTSAMTLEREDLLERAAADFATAVRLNRAARIDKRHFSPKLVAFFEQIKSGIAK
jgi:hypothetical protein